MRTVNFRTAYLFIVIALSIFSVIGGGTAFAGEHGTHGEHSAGIGSLKLFFINFAVYAVLIIYLLRRQFLTGWPLRRQRIAYAVAQGRERLTTAQEQLVAAERQLAGVKQESIDLQNTIETESRRESEETVRAANSVAQRITANAEQSCRAEERAAQAQIRRELARIVIRQATEKLKGRVSGESDRVMRQSALQGIARLIH